MLGQTTPTSMAPLAESTIVMAADHGFQPNNTSASTEVKSCFRPKGSVTNRRGRWTLKRAEVGRLVAGAHLHRKLVVQDHALSKPFLTMLFAAATIASWGSRKVQLNTRRAFSFEVFFA